MNSQLISPELEFKKNQISDTVAFAIDNIPSVDQHTLEKFLQLVHTTGTFGAITPPQLINKMRLTMKYIPNACAHSLLVIAELLELRGPGYPKMSAKLTGTPANQSLQGQNHAEAQLNGGQPVRINH